jgi:Terpene cyclase DEP1
MRNVYLFLCIAGAVLPLWQFVPWVQANGLDIPRFFTDLFANRIGGFFAMDVLVSAVALIIWIQTERPRYWWAAVLGTLCIGVSFGLPLHLYLRSRNFSQ